MVRELGENDFIVSKTDTKGRITYVNKNFMNLAEYTEEELLGKPHSIIRHPDMPKAVFKLLWDRIQAKEEIFAFVVNKTKNNNSYWVYANVTPSLDERGNIIGYYSVRRKPNAQALEAIKPIYSKMLQAEKSGGVESGMKILTDLLDQEGVSYDEYIISLQK
ncbi:PAS domain-containing protein [Sulfurimonas autotrophica]|uniref:Putative PAS/PAC sensor protein n=1 Tax=Sulfurimonas autotrophica (strain ATCC BAA-671 / DSM 16294 / JCM 11897 / OK10) TaxID=563040 RepID=E0USU4_SULAO|nr:PAS domain-containing protein [Sulfurimonas autotrophica]ADN08121.1 putative PAS/PAC sensor protein [Sulfurimonas autotrophica DSM 16294]